MNKALHDPDWTAKADLEFNIEDCWISERVGGQIKFTKNYLEYVVADDHKKALIELVDSPGWHVFINQFNQSRWYYLRSV